MKTRRNLVLIFIYSFLFVNICFSQAQLKLFSLAYNNFNTKDEGFTFNSFKPYADFITFSTCEWGSNYNLMYGSTGEPLFYVDQNVIYNSQKEIAEFDNCYNNSETVIMPVPESEGLDFYIFSPYEYFKLNTCEMYSNNYYPVHDYLDVSTPAVPYEGRTDAPCYLLAGSNLIEDTEGDYRLLFVYYSMHTPSDQTDYFHLIIYKVTNSTVSFLKDYNLLSFDPNIKWIDGYGSEMELVKLPQIGGGDHFRLAIPYVREEGEPVSSYYPSIFIGDFDEVGEIQATPDRYDIYELRNAIDYVYGTRNEILNQHLINGLEFSPSGDYLYMSITPGNMALSCNLYPDPEDIYKGIAYMQVNSSRTGSIYSSQTINGLKAPVSPDYNDICSNGGIELGYNNKLYFASNTSLKQLDLNQIPGGPSNIDGQNVDDVWKSIPLPTGTTIPRTHQITINGSPSCIHPYRGLFVLPDQIDGENYDNYLTSKECCSVEPSYDEDDDYTTPAETLTISPSSNIWGSQVEVYIEDNFIIPSGSKVTIEDMKFLFGPDAKVIILQNGSLTLHNTIFTNAECNEMWHGIDVYGSEDDDQELHSGVNSQGSLILENQSQIINAHIGVCLGGCDIPGGGTTEGGGIIKADDSKFINCRNSVDFGAYIDFENISYFRKCNFLCTDLMSDFTEYTSYTGNGLNTFVSMWLTKGIHFNSCNFINSSTSDGLYGVNQSQFDIDRRGYGIYSVDASFWVSKDYTLDYPCSDIIGNTGIFEGLSFGIKIEETQILSGTSHHIIDNYFKNVIFPIDCSDDHNTVIYNNDFAWRQDFQNNVAYNTDYFCLGVKSVNSTQIVIDENNFDWFYLENLPTYYGNPTNYWFNEQYPTVLGTYLEETNGASEVKLNNFINWYENEQQFILGSIYNNIVTSNLIIDKNFNYDLANDWILDGYSSSFGTQSFGLLNIFTTSPEFSNIDNRSGGNPFIYYYNNTVCSSYNTYPTTNNNMQTPTYSPRSGSCPFTNPIDVSCDYYPQAPCDPCARKIGDFIDSNNNILNIYPIPATDNFSIFYSLANTNEHSELLIYNSFGKLILTKELSSRTGILSMSKDDLGKSGVYICVLSNTKTKIKQLFVITQ